VGECADHRRLGIGSEFRADRRRVTLRAELFRLQGVVENGDPIAGNPLRDQIVSHRIGDGQQVTLTLMPTRRGKALHVANRLGTAKRL
jgi:hypothetical protein